MDEVNAYQSTSSSTSAIASEMVSNSTTETSCVDIEVDVELNPIQSVESPFPSRESSSFDGFDGGQSVSTQGFDREDSVFAHGFDVEDAVPDPFSPLLPFYPTENFAAPGVLQRSINWPRVITILAGVTIIIMVGLISTVVFMNKRGKTNFECKIRFTVSKDGTSNFTAVSEAVKAAPSYSKQRVCIFVKAGEYHEIVKIGKEKNNLVLMGEGIGKTKISSNASSYRHVVPFPAATLSIDDIEFLAQDLTITNTAKHGVAVENWADRSVFFRCKLEGTNATLHVKGHRQFYRSCHLYGKSNLVFGYAHAFFQNCEFFSEKSYPNEKIVFSSQSNPMRTFKSVFIFHFCAFHVANKSLNSSETTFLGSSLGNDAIFVVMQSYIDASIGGYFLSTSAPKTSDYFMFGNEGHGATMENIPPFVHVLNDVNEASKYSLRVFQGGGNWIPPEVEHDLDLHK
ncbi:hypothetical protein OROGR_029373 [Orobanche gracilis]